jgi:hypothetical protein
MDLERPIIVRVGRFCGKVLVVGAVGNVALGKAEGHECPIQPPTYSETCDIDIAANSTNMSFTNSLTALSPWGR